MSNFAQRLARKLGFGGQAPNEAGSLTLKLPHKLRRGRLRHHEADSVQSGVDLIELMSSSLGLPDLGNTSVLDMGCGCKFTQAILDRNLPVGKYTGVDIYREMVDFLRDNVSDPRFSFYHMNSHNEMYNPEGELLSEDTELPLGDEKFDLICLFSVFTHLAPHDYVSMLKVLRKYIKPEGRLFFTLFVNERTPGGYGQIDSMHKAFSQTTPEQLEKHREDFLANDGRDKEIPDFIDLFPQKPLRVAMYSRQHALKLLEGTGWEVESLNDPQQHIQHYMICKPT